MDSEWYVHAFAFLDRHPVAFVSVLVVVGSLLLVVGIPLPQRTIRQTKDGIETVWSMKGGIPGIGRGLVEIARAMLKFSEAQASEREQARTAHAAELASQRKIMETVQDEQQRTTQAIAQSNTVMQQIATDLHALVSWVYNHVHVDPRDDKRKDKHADVAPALVTPIPAPSPSRVTTVPNPDAEPISRPSRELLVR